MNSAIADVVVCPICEGPRQTRFGVCYCCELLARQLRVPLVPIVAVANYRSGDGLHRRLRGYKDAPVAEARGACTTELASLVDTWMLAQGTRLREHFGSSWDVVATVPSSHRPAGAPVDAVVARVPQLDRLRRPLLLRGPESTDHLVAARRGFALRPGVDRGWLRNQRVLVVDDSVITGARAQSAATALRLDGVRVVGVVAIGRMVTPGSGGPKLAFWEAHLRREAPAVWQ
jgi:hypothetical protein